jgi:hypothetical protein
VVSSRPQPCSTGWALAAASLPPGWAIWNVAAHPDVGLVAMIRQLRLEVPGPVLAGLAPGDRAAEVRGPQVDTLKDSMVKAGAQFDAASAA